MWVSKYETSYKWKIINKSTKQFLKLEIINLFNNNCIINT